MTRAPHRKRRGAITKSAGSVGIDQAAMVAGSKQTSLRGVAAAGLAWQRSLGDQHWVMRLTQTEKAGTDNGTFWNEMGRRRMLKRGRPPAGGQMGGRRGPGAASCVQLACALALGERKKGTENKKGRPPDRHRNAIRNPEGLKSKGQWQNTSILSFVARSVAELWTGSCRGLERAPGHGGFELGTWDSSGV